MKVCPAVSTPMNILNRSHLLCFSCDCNATCTGTEFKEMLSLVALVDHVCTKRFLSSENASQSQHNSTKELYDTNCIA